MIPSSLALAAATLTLCIARGCGIFGVLTAALTSLFGLRHDERSA